MIYFTYVFAYIEPLLLLYEQANLWMIFFIFLMWFFFRFTSISLRILVFMFIDDIGL